MAFRDDPPPRSGGGGRSNAAREIAADLRANQGKWGEVASYPLPTRHGNEELDEVTTALKKASFPSTANELIEHAQGQNASDRAVQVLRAVRNHETDEEPRRYGTLETVIDAVLKEQTRRVRARASSLTGVISGGRTRAYYPAGTYQARQVTDDDENGHRVVFVWATYRGEEYAWPEEDQPKPRKNAPNYPPGSERKSE